MGECHFFHCFPSAWLTNRPRLLPYKPTVWVLSKPYNIQRFAYVIYCLAVRYYQWFWFTGRTRDMISSCLSYIPISEDSITISSGMKIITFNHCVAPLDPLNLHTFTDLYVSSIVACQWVVSPKFRTYSQYINFPTVLWLWSTRTCWCTVLHSPEPYDDQIVLKSCSVFHLQPWKLDCHLWSLWGYFNHIYDSELNQEKTLYLARNMSGTTQHCSFVLLADFDIDRGAQLTYQFPQPLGMDEGYATLPGICVALLGRLTIGA